MEGRRGARKTYPRYTFYPQAIPLARLGGACQLADVAGSGRLERGDKLRTLPPRRRPRSFGIEAKRRGGQGARRKKREAKAPADAEPTFRKGVQRNRSLRRRNREPGPYRNSNVPIGDRNPGTGRSSNALEGSRREPATAAMSWMEPGTGTCRGSNAPEEPWRPGEAAMLRRRSDPGTCWNRDIPEEPKGNRPGPKGLGRNPTGNPIRRRRRRGNPCPAEKAAPFEARRSKQGQWGLVATPAPITHGREARAKGAVHADASSRT